MVLTDTAWRRHGAVTVPLLILALWQFASMLPGYPAQAFSSPVAIFQALARALVEGSMLRATWQTFSAAVGGTLLGCLIGLAGGVVTGLSRISDRSSRTLIEFLRPVPGVAIMPIALLVVGFGWWMEVTVVAFATLWPMLVMMRSAVRSVDPQKIEVARVLEFSRAATIRKFVLPAVLREGFVALQLAMGVGFVVAVTVEIAVNPMGLGYQLVVAQAALRADLVFASLVWVGLVGWVTASLLDWIRTAAFGWSAQT